MRFQVYRILDKHGYAHQTFNARMIFDREDSDAIQLGLATGELGEFEAAPALYDIRLLNTAR